MTMLDEEVSKNSRDSKHGPVLLDRLTKVRNDPWYFLSNCVYTLDEVDKITPIKKFPSEGEKGPYLKLYTGIWMREQFIAVPKSRRMFMTWVNVSLYLWDTMWHFGRNNGFVSKKEEDANELLKKAKFILEHIPADFLPKDLLPKWEHTFCKLQFPELNSIIRGYPQGPDQARMFTHSGLLMDECAFWVEARDTYSAAMPTLEGGGRCTMLSSPAPGFFSDLVFDKLDQESKGRTK